MKLRVAMDVKMFLTFPISNQNVNFDLWFTIQFFVILFHASKLLLTARTSLFAELWYLADGLLIFVLILLVHLDLISACWIFLGMP